MSAARRPRPENPAVSTVRLTATGLPRSPAARAVCHALNKKRISVGRAARAGPRHPTVLRRPNNHEGVFTFDLARDGRE